MEEDTKPTLHQDAEPFLFRKARELRKNSTEAEQKLWGRLRNKEFLNLKFRQQHPLGNYIADFYCHSLKLVVEIDGGYHFTGIQQEKDKYRETELIKNGIQVLRFTNEEVLADVERVLGKIGELVG